MKKIGISLYPAYSTKEDNMRYLKKAAECNCSLLFLALLGVGEDRQTVIDNYHLGAEAPALHPAGRQGEDAAGQRPEGAVAAVGAHIEQRRAESGQLRRGEIAPMARGQQRLLAGEQQHALAGVAF